MLAASRSKVLSAFLAALCLLAAHPASGASAACANVEQQIAVAGQAVAEARAQNTALRFQLAELHGALEKMRPEFEGLKSATGYDGRGGFEPLAAPESNSTAAVAEPPPTRIEVDEAHNVIRFFIHGREVLRADENGVAVDGSVMTLGAESGGVMPEGKQQEPLNIPPLEEPGDMPP